MKTFDNKKNYFLSSVPVYITIQHKYSGLIAVPIVLDYLGKEKYGVWALLTSIIVYLNISGLGLTTAASVLIAKNNDFADKLLIAKRVLVLLITSVTVFLAIFLFLDSISNKWIDIIGVIPDNLRTEVHKAFFG